MAFRPLRISRRTLLRGSGVAIALPWLEAMHDLDAEANQVPANSHQGRPVRFATLFMPNGVRPDRWTPTGSGRDYELSEILHSLAACRDDVIVLTNLRNANSLGGDGHYAKTANLLTGTRIAKTTGRNISSGGISLDQLAAARYGRMTPLSSLELATEPVASGIDTNVGFTRLYASHISWRTATMPMPTELRPRVVFDRLFRTSVRDADRSILDHAAEDARRLAKRLGRSDRNRLAEYLDSLRAVEQRIERISADRVETTRGGDATDPAKPGEDGRPHALDTRELLERIPAGVPSSHEEHVQLMLDLIVLAFATDTTRIATFMFGNAVSGRDFSFLDGVSGGHHEQSHHQHEAPKLDAYQRINTWHVDQLSYFLNRLRSIPEGEGNLLDNSLVLFGSGLRDGNAHDPNDLPIVLAGRGGGTVETGRHIVCPQHTPLCNLHLAILERLGVDEVRFGDSSGRVGL